ncbi:MAG TPA: DUF3017 domain-containing protein [Propionibacteriaceae bacterium]|nr:DUF3017 domain-containing protein [Propionibacteriaceae bacterium]
MITVGNESGSTAGCRQWPLLLVVIGVACGLGITLLSRDTWRLGCLVIGASLAVGAVERLVLPDRDAGLLSVRSRAFDTVVMGFTGVAIVALAIVVPERR